MEKTIKGDPSAEKVQDWEKKGNLHFVTVSAQNFNSTPGQVYIQIFDLRAKGVRTAKILGIFWGSALVSILIPLLHFILFPVLFLCGPFFAWQTFQQDALILGGTSECPKCRSPFKIISSKIKWPIKDVCGQCYQSVEIAPLP
jgi:hypothetical protein